MVYFSIKKVCHSFKHSGSTMWTMPTSNTYLHKCALAPHGNISSILDRLCPENCSSHGICNKGMFST